ncbi:MAG: hypothetical protein R6U59_02290 [Eubacteriales bacterium]
MAKKGILYVIVGILIVMGFWTLVVRYFSELDLVPLENENIYKNHTLYVTTIGYKTK